MMLLLNLVKIVMMVLVLMGLDLSGVCSVVYLVLGLVHHLVLKCIDSAMPVIPCILRFVLH
jgi:hypothetical protein